jgi:hypothetical protein
VGTKLTAFVPVAVLTIGVAAFAARRRRRSTLMAWLGPVVVMGSFWYVRNLVHIGNPVPALHVALGGLSLPRPHIDKIDHFGYSVAHYLPQGKLLRTVFVPEVRHAFGVVWPATLLLAAAGLVLSAAQARAPIRRLAGVAGMASALAYLVTPTSAGGPPGLPVFFEANLRYLWPALLLGLVLLPTCEAVSGRRIAPWVLAVLVFVLVATELSRGAWLHEYRGPAAVVGALVVGCVAVVGALRRMRPRPDVRAASVLVGLMVVGAIGYPAQRAFGRHRYADKVDSLSPAYMWAGGVRAAPVAITGIFTQFPLYGPDLSNRVQYMGHHGPHGAFSVIGTCREWRETVTKGRFRYVVTAPGIPTDPVPAAAAWTRTDPAAREIVSSDGVSVFALGGPLDPSRCGGPR